MCEITNALNTKIDELNRALGLAYENLDRIDTERRAARGQIGLIVDLVAQLKREVDRVPTRLSVAVAEINKPLTDRIVEMLSGEYQLRTMQAVIDAVGHDADAIIEMLDEAGVAFVTKVRRGDGALLLGLASRN